MTLYSIPTDRPLEALLPQEWLLTNGIGGFASSTLPGCNTRRYHGLLCAATLPPVGRVMMLNRIGEIVNFDGQTEPTHEFSVNQFKDRFHPRGEQYLKRFELDDIARFEYEIEGTRIIKEVQVLWKQNVVGIRYTIEPGQKWRVKLQLLPFVSMRDFHALRRYDPAAAPFNISVAGRRVSVGEGKWTLHLVADAGEFIDQPDWWHNHTYALESERGLDDQEDLFNPGRLVFQTEAKAAVTLWAGADWHDTFDWDAELLRRHTAVAAGARISAAGTAGHAPFSPSPGNPGEGGGEGPCKSSSPNPHPDPLPEYRERGQSQTLPRLLRAAHDFVVYRKSPDGSDGTSILAGYPWFSDWGRDTMISAPGLLLATGRLEQARQVLCVYAKYVSEGMIPNRFDDYNNQPHYNTVDASLWFIHAVHEYLRFSKDQETFRTELQPACQAIIDGYRRGTRFQIKMDEGDGLISQGDHSTQLTWMDAKCDGVVFTPRQGKAVEINALWYHALMLCGQTDLAAQVAASFRKTFWISPFRGLADVVDGRRRDASLRPNQIFAVSLPHSPLSEDQQSAVVEVVRRELLTPMGLRSLGPREPGYQGRYTGPPRQRDSAYHNGTVWAWLIGPFLDAYLRVHHRSPQSLLHARQWLQPLIDHLGHSVGQIAEIFDGDAPHRPVGCFAQAWSVAEVLRLAVSLDL